jgi:hypothetical protein
MTNTAPQDTRSTSMNVLTTSTKAFSEAMAAVCVPYVLATSWMSKPQKQRRYSTSDMNSACLLVS